MDKIIFNNANEVRIYVIDQGFQDKIKIRWMNNPFGGNGHFNVTLAQVPQGVSVVSSSGSNRDYQFGSSDGGVTAGRLVRLRELLKGTNAACTG